MKVLRLRAVDTLSFGSLKNFTAEESHYQLADFPPSIMRFFNLGKKLKIMGVFLEKDNEVYLPIPSDTLSKRKEEGKEAFVPEFDHTLKRPYYFGKENVEQAKGLCSLTDFINKYSKNEKFSIVNLDLAIEERTGIKLNYSTRATEEGFLYSRAFLRLKDLSIILLTEGEYDKIRYATIGGERRLAYIEEKDFSSLSNFLLQEVKIDKEKIYKFYATTHLHFDPKEEIKINGLRFSLEWISSQEPEWISGFAKPFVYMLKPSTVLWLRAKDSGVMKRLCKIFVKVNVIKLIGK